MPTMQDTGFDAGVASRLPAGPILIRLRGVLLTAAAAALVYSALGGGSRSECSGGGMDSDGNTPPESCVSLTMHPSWVVYAALGVILFVAIGRIARRADTLPAALRILDQAAILMIGLVLVSVAIGLVWLFAVPLDVVRGTGTVIFPFPFNAPDVTFTHTP